MDLILKPLRIPGFNEIISIAWFKMLNRLNGMFAFAIWDKLEKKKLLFGIEWVLSLCTIRFTTKHFILPRTKALFTAGVPLKMAQDGLEYIFNRFVAGEILYIKT
jgi:asparagine synthase (glutamine-hydrolysing)